MSYAPRGGLNYGHQNYARGSILPRPVGQGMNVANERMSVGYGLRNKEKVTFDNIDFSKPEKFLRQIY